MKKLPLHDSIIDSCGIVEKLLSLKSSSVKYIAKDEYGDVYAYVDMPDYDGAEWSDDNNMPSYLFISESDSIDPSTSCEKIDWDYLTGSGSDEPSYDMTKLGDLYQALLDGHVIKTWNEYAENQIKYVKFDPETQEFLYSSDGYKTFHLVGNSPNSIFLNVCEIYNTPTKPTERLWIYYNYSSSDGITYMDSKFVPIDHEQTNECGYKWIKTEEVR